MNMPTPERTKTGKWAIIIAIVLAAHLALFILVRPSFFAIFRKPLPSTAETGKAGSAPSDAILTIPIEIEAPYSGAEEGAATEPFTEIRKRIVVAESAEPGSVEGEPEADVLLDADNLPVGSPKAHPRSAGSADVTIPPRAVEITWPDTRKLRHCLEHRIDIRIRVGDDGSVLAVESPDGGHPPDCVRAALESAAKIVFEPGRVNGVPVAMWTQVRIEFRAKD
jgi:hypothetical protein